MKLTKKEFDKKFKFKSSSVSNSLMNIDDPIAMKTLDCFSKVRVLKPKQKDDAHMTNKISNYADKIEEFYLSYETESDKKRYFDDKLNKIHLQIEKDKKEEESKIKEIQKGDANLIIYQNMFKNVLKTSTQKNNKNNNVNSQIQRGSCTFSNNFQIGVSNNKSDDDNNLQIQALKYYTKQEEEIRKKLMNHRISLLFGNNQKLKDKIKLSKQIVLKKNKPNKDLTNNILTTNFTHTSTSFFSTEKEDTESISNLKSTHIKTFYKNNLTTNSNYNSKANTNANTKSYFFSPQQKIKSHEEKKSFFMKFDQLNKECSKRMNTAKKAGKNIKNEVKRFSKSMNLHSPEYNKKHQSDVDKHILRLASETKKEMGYFLYGEGGKKKGQFYKDEQDKKKKDNYEIVSKIDDLNAYNARNILIDKFKIQIGGDEKVFDYKPSVLNNNNLSYITQIPVHKRVSTLVNQIAGKKDLLMQKIKEKLTNTK
jgi:hypothetical protein